MATPRKPGTGGTGHRATLSQRHRAVRPVGVFPVRAISQVQRSYRRRWYGKSLGALDELSLG